VCCCIAIEILQPGGAHNFIWIVATTDIGVFTDIGDKISRYRVTCHDIGVFV
jgi:hypothetical protein